MSETDVARANAVSMGISFVAAAVWVIYGLAGAPKWLLLVGVMFSMFTGWWWAFARPALFRHPGVGGDSPTPE